MEFNAYTYSFPFKKPFKTSSGTFSEREGVILELKKNDIIALGDAAPLPGFSVESLEEVIQQLKELSAEIKALVSNEISLESFQVFHRKQDIYPSLQFALDTLGVDFLSQHSQTSAHDLLFDNPAKKLQCNGVVPISARETTINKVRELTEKGYTTIKIKVGQNYNNELEQLGDLRSSFPELIIRVDANRAWEIDEAIENLTGLEALDIEYCEEPLANPTVKNYKRLSNATSVPLALDESFPGFKDWNSILPEISVLIVKPMVIGGLTKLFATNRLANNHGNKVIYTTSLESGIGRAMTVILAAGLGSRDSAHGLSTGSLLTMDVWNDGTYINNGSVHLPDRSKLGQRYHSNHKYLEPGLIDL